MSQRVPILLLLAGCVVLAAVVFGELGAADPRDPTAMAAPAAPEAAPAAHPESRARIDQLAAATLARPLFDQSRRPPQSTDAAAAGADLGDARLTGIVTEPGRRVAIFDVTGAKPLTLGEGESVSGWHIDGITPLQVMVTGPGGAKTLRPKPDPNLAARLAAAAPAAASPVLAPRPPVPIAGMPPRPGVPSVIGFPRPRPLVPVRPRR